MTTKIIIFFSAKLLAEIDRIAREEHRSRSELVREAIRLYVEMRRHKRVPMDLPKVRQAVATQDRLARLDPGTGEDSAIEIRRWREAH